MAVAEGRTGFEWMDATLEWLLSLFNLTRLLVALWGSLWVLQAGGNVLNYLEGPPDLSSPFMPMYRHGMAFCWRDPNPGAALLLSLVYLAPAVSAMVLVWRLPRTGFLLSALGWILVWAGTLHHDFSEREQPIPWRWLPWLLLPSLWLTGAAWKLRPQEKRP